MQELRSRAGVAARPGLPALLAPATRLLDRPLALLGIALALRFSLAGALLGTNLLPHNGWYFPNDDQVFFWGLAHAVADGELATTPTTMGYSLVLVPFAAVSDFVLQAIPPVAVVQLLLALPLAALLYRAGVRLFDRRSALLGTALWLASPLLLGLILSWYGRPFASATIWLGLDISVDFFSAAVAICLLALVAGALEDGSASRGALVGAVAGLAFLGKPNNVLMFAAVLTALAVWRRWRAATVAVLTAAVVAAPQLVYNHRLYGTPFEFAYASEFDRPEWELVSLENVARAFGKLVIGNALGPLLLVGAAVALFVVWRRFPQARWLVVAQVVASTFFFASIYYAGSTNFLRYLAPVVPLVCLAAGAALVGRPGAQGGERGRRPGMPATSLGTAAVVGAVALAVWIERAPPAEALPTVEDMAPAAEVEGGEVTLRWEEPSAPADLTYQVIRSRDGPATPTFGFRNDNGPTADQGRTFGVRFGTVLADRPGPGVWWYRIAITPGAHPGGWPPSVTVGYSQPLRVVVPDPARPPQESQ